MGNATLKDRVVCIVIVQMNGIAVGGNLSKHFDIAVSDDLLQMARHAHFNVFDTDRSAWQIVQHETLHLGLLSNNKAHQVHFLKQYYFASAA